MDFIESLEISDAKIQVSKQNITIDTSITNHTNIKIENIYGGFLHGEIIKEDESITLSTNLIDKNHINLNIYINSDFIDQKSKYETSIKIISNGGDITIQIHIINEKIPLKISDIKQIYNVKEFYEFQKYNKVLALSIFTNNEFLKWLEKFDTNYSQLYNFVNENENKYRMMDNFFILLGYKNKTEVTPINRNIVIKTLPYIDRTITGSIVFTKSELEYCDFNLFIKNESDFFKLSKTKFSNDEFDEDGYIEVFYKINLEKMKNKREDFNIYINNNINNFITIKIIKLPYIKALTNKNIYKDKESGQIQIQNLSKTNIKYEIKSSNNNIIIPDSKGEFVGDLNIDFVVKLTTFNQGVVKFFKQPYFTTKVSIYCTADNLKVKKDLLITIATENLVLK